jgi:antitoxin component HigA of HigAB toxin-antitoxin module
MAKVKTTSRKKKVYIDTKGVFAKIKRETGEKITAKSFCEDYGFSAPTITQWNKEAPNTIAVVYHFLKKHNLQFEDLVKLG